MIHNLLSSTEIADILNNHIVITNKDKLSSQNKVDFSIELPVEIKAKIEDGFGINLQQIASIPMRWIKGDTPQHIDKGENDFNNTYLMYLTDSTGNLLIDGQSYPINAGDAYIFNEGIAHSTINTGDNERLMIGPMSEAGVHVGLPPAIFYFNNETDAQLYPDETINFVYSGSYIIESVNDISSWVIESNTDGTDPTPNGGQYNTGDELINTGTYYLYPYTTPDPDPVPPTPTQTRSLYMRSLFTNNSQIYYKSGSLCTGSGGVTNSRIKKRRT
jgi:hypothetical protein